MTRRRWHEQWNSVSEKRDASLPFCHLCQWLGQQRTMALLCEPLASPPLSVRRNSLLLTSQRFVPEPEEDIYTVILWSYIFKHLCIFTKFLWQGFTLNCASGGPVIMTILCLASIPSAGAIFQERKKWFLNFTWTNKNIHLNVTLLARYYLFNGIVMHNSMSKDLYLSLRF